ncbi:uncharacterized protein LOC134239920 [Saccostrea cucullata]|uniref:uncharacterized protein LOC134239920 n=1 Tax=Saccostrea cuccullata TaxID=36930 RepID=UPI002ED11CBF
MDKSTGSKKVFMSNHPELGRLDSLAIFADERIDVSSLCSKKNGNCSTFCFPTPTGRTCGCQDNVDLQADQKTCQGVSRCSTSLPNVNFFNCLPYPGQTCTIDCKPGYRLLNSKTITCDNNGQWVPFPSSLCTEAEIYDETPSLTGVYIGSSVGGVIIIVTFITAIVCFIKRKKPPINDHEDRPLVNDNSYTTFQNNGFTLDELQDRTSSHIYSTIGEIHNTEKNPYLEPIS